MTYTYYIVVYKAVPNAKHSKSAEPFILNELLCDIHPLVWLARPIKYYDENFTSYLLFFAEIPEDVALDPDTMKYFGKAFESWYL